MTPGGFGMIVAIAGATQRPAGAMAMATDLTVDTAGKTVTGRGSGRTIAGASAGNAARMNWRVGAKAPALFVAVPAS
jgi:hypothetical protein